MANKDRVAEWFQGNFTEENLGVEGLKDLGALFMKGTDDPGEKLKIAKFFLQAISQVNQEALNEFLGIKLLEKCSQRPEGEDCFGYLFGQDADSKAVLVDLISNYVISLAPTVGAYALYVDMIVNHPLHLGKVVGGGRVVSKWGALGHVFEHEPLLVPASYGSNIAYLSKKD